MDQTVEKLPLEGSTDSSSAENGASSAPQQKPQSGMSILFNILLFILVPTVLLVLTKLLTD